MGGSETCVRGEDVSPFLVDHAGMVDVTSMGLQHQLQNGKVIIWDTDVPHAKVDRIFLVGPEYEDASTLPFGEKYTVRLSIICSFRHLKLYGDPESNVFFARHVTADHAEEKFIFWIGVGHKYFNNLKERNCMQSKMGSTATG